MYYSTRYLAHRGTAADLLLPDPLAMFKRERLFESSPLSRGWDSFRGVARVVYRNKFYRLILVAASLAAVGIALWLLLDLGSQKHYPFIDLGYAKYQGLTSDKGVDLFLGMRFAAPPVGDLRFRAPIKPENATKVQPATDFGTLCLGIETVYTTHESEDCLFINVWKPTHATPDSKLPVWVFIYGGGYQGLANANYDGSAIVTASGDNVVFVSFNYRTSAWGFLASEKVQADGNLNVGLLDQRRALEWVQEHIHQFGGDPQHVVAHGASAGAGSLAFHLTAYGGRDDGLFVGAIFESPFVPTHPEVFDVESQFDRFVSDAKCAEATDQMTCLRSQPTSVLQAASAASPHPGRTNEPLFYWTPTIDGGLVQGYLSHIIEEGKVMNVPVMIGGATNEGTLFARNATTPTEVADFFLDQYPHLGSTDVAAINAEYPLMDPLPMHAPYFPSLAAAYGDATFTCPANRLAISLTKYTSPAQVWDYRFNVLQEDFVNFGLGVPHTFETLAIWGVESAYDPNLQTSYTTYNKNIVPVVMHYFISFVRALDPNKFRYKTGSPEWSNWGEGGGKRLVLETNRTRMEDVPEDQGKKCEFWKELAGKMKH